ncbi:hypothetical protein [Meridianimarinicoccus marinus]|uniref:hypothetical protein n=1 Tax=Meridianimarinicoccus marinus TaxID=3231483 RepID=UPI00344B7D27
MRRSVRNLVALWATAVVLGATTAQADPGRDFVALSLGRMTDNAWETPLSAPGNIDWRDSYGVALAAGREWPLFNWGYIGVEANLLAHWGEQDNWELAAPVYLRSLQPESWLLPGLAYGLGLSYASDVPSVEVDRKGESQQWLAYWFIELEFGRPSDTVRPFLRLHHRSDAFGTFEADTGSNMVFLGLRHAF